MVLTRAQEFKQLWPGLNAIFGEEYKQYENEHTFLFDSETSDKAFEEEVLFPGFGGALVKAEGSAVTYADTAEAWIARYNHETIALAFAITEEAVEDNLYLSLSKKLTKALARAMAHTKQTKGSNVYNRAFNTSYTGGDGVTLLNTAHPLQSGATHANKPTTDADLSETALEDALVAIAGFVDDKDIPIALTGKTLIIPRQLLFVAERLLSSPYRVATSDNDVNAIYNMNALPGGYKVNHRLTDTDAWFIRTDSPSGMKMFQRVPMQNKLEGDFETGNVRYKSRERYSFGWSDWRGLYGSSGG